MSAPRSLRLAAPSLAVALALSAPQALFAQDAPARTQNPTEPTAALPRDPTPGAVATQAPTPPATGDNPEQLADVTVRAPSAARLRAIRQRCIETNGVDWFAWISGGGLIAAGAALVVTQLVMIEPPRRTPLNWYGVGLGPGLILGGIGVPFARGILRGVDPLAAACRDVARGGRLDGRPTDALDAEQAARLLTSSAQPTSVTLIVLLSAASAAVAGAAIGAIVAGNNEIAQMTGGFSAAAITGWFIVPPTPVRIAATRFVTDVATQPGVRTSANDGWGLTVSGAF